jgi:hypothetical protein
MVGTQIHPNLAGGRYTYFLCCYRWLRFAYLNLSLELCAIMPSFFLETSNASKDGKPPAPHSAVASYDLLLP